MKYLIKDLACVSNLHPDRIRKWQERYHLLKPELGSNGYYYYSNEDLKILLYVKNELSKGKKISQIIAKPRQELLKEITQSNEFSTEELSIIEAISNFNYKPIERKLYQVLKKKGFYSWLREIHKLIILTGKTWEKNLITISDEHSFSNWLKANLLTYIVRNLPKKKPVWLVSTFPGDPHELGALLHYIKLLKFKVPARYVGNLPKEELLKEIKIGSYRVVSISIVLPQKWKVIQNLKHQIEKLDHTKVLFGGYGYKQIKVKLNQKDYI